MQAVSFRALPFTRPVESRWGPAHRSAYARANPALLDKLEQTGRLPMQQLADATGVERKTLERHRKYLVAFLLAFTNGYEIIRGHLCQLDRGERRGGQ